MNYVSLISFCYLGDMLSVDGDTDAAVEARIRIGWNKFRQLVSQRSAASSVIYGNTSTSF